MRTTLQTLQAETIRTTGLYFERGKPNESLGLGSPGQLAGGNEMKQSSRAEGRKKKKQDGRVGGRHIWAEFGK